VLTTGDSTFINVSGGETSGDYYVNIGSTPQAPRAGASWESALQQVDLQPLGEQQKDELKQIIHLVKDHEKELSEPIGLGLLQVLIPQAIKISPSIGHVIGEVTLDHLEGPDIRSSVQSSIRNLIGE